MSLKITQNNGTFEVIWKINTATAKSFKQHFNFILNSLDKLTIDINKVNEIDVCGLRAFKELYQHPNLNSKTFFIVGDGCKEIYEEFIY